MQGELQQTFLEHPLDADKLDRYYREAVARDQIDSARAALAQLQVRYPWNHQLRKTYIALCLYQQDYLAAMEGIEKLVAFSKADDALVDSALTVRGYLGPRRISGRSMTESSLSLCMIVKNEQAFLGPCLNAIKTLVDEIVVFDTGSTDRSADIARIYGARVYDFSWCDDFSAARNASLDKAEGAWVLILDADEIIAPRDHDCLRQIITDGIESPCAYSFKTRNYCNLANAMDWQANDHGYPRQEAGIGWFPTSKVRLFPRYTGIRFSYPVHELVDPSVRAQGLPIVDCPVPIHHYGHLNEHRNARKARHYFHLGYAKLDQLGQDPAALRELAIQAGQLEKWTEAIELWQRFLKISPHQGNAYANLAGAYWQIGRYKQGALFSRKAIGAIPELKEGHYNLAVNLLMQDQPDTAAAILRDTLQKHPKYLAARFMLAATCIVLGDSHQARSIFAGLKREMPEKALVYAIESLADKFKGAGLGGYAELLEATVELTG